jgi:4-hydroxy-2-oxoglutarate aldolase
VGTKLSCGNIGKLHRITSSIPKEKFAVFAGKSDVLLQGLLSGSAGVIGALVNIAPKTHRQLYELWEQNDVVEAMKIQSVLGQADWNAQKVGGIGGIKKVVSRNFGYGQGFVRGPLAPLSEEKEKSIDTSKLDVLIKLESSSN